MEDPAALILAGHGFGGRCQQPFTTAAVEFYLGSGGSSFTWDYRREGEVELKRKGKSATLYSIKH